jgi:hypothetical protein
MWGACGVGPPRPVSTPVAKYISTTRCRTLPPRVFLVSHTQHSLCQSLRDPAVMCAPALGGGIREAANSAPAASAARAAGAACSNNGDLSSLRLMAHKIIVTLNYTHARRQAPKRPRGLLTSIVDGWGWSTPESCPAGLFQNKTTHRIGLNFSSFLVAHSSPRLFASGHPAGLMPRNPIQ